MVEIVPIFHTVFAHVYHYAISELCKGLYHHNGVCHESPRPQIHRFRPHRRERRHLEYVPSSHLNAERCVCCDTRSAVHDCVSSERSESCRELVGRAV